jgi:hydrogenase expression/formation protein HypD
LVEEFHDPGRARRVLDDLHAVTSRPWTLMEVCGGQTHAIVRYGLDQLLPPGVELIHGPGCPVCVTPVGIVDRACALAERPEVTLCTFGDMVRVPGSAGDLSAVRSAGGDVRVVYSPLDAVRLAEAEPRRHVVLLAVGFETTAPANALAVREADRLGLANFSVLVAHVRVPPALEAILAAPGCRVQAFLLAGHVCTVMGTDEYEPLVARHGVPMVVTGFEPLDVLEGIRRATRQLESGRAELENAYERVARPDGNTAARAVIDDVFVVCDRDWRGIGPIPAGGLRLAGRYRHFDAVARFDVGDITTAEATLGPGSREAGAGHAPRVESRR